MDKNNKGYAFYVPQGGFAVFKISKSKKEEGEGQKSEEIRVPKIDEVFTDGLSPCSYVIIIIETPTANYCIFAHMDTCTMNISDPETGLFKQVLDIIGQDRDSSSVTIYHEVGLKQQNLADNINHFDYEQFFRMQLAKYNFNELPIKINENKDNLDYRAVSIKLSSLEISDNMCGTKDTDEGYRKQTQLEIASFEQEFIEIKRLEVLYKEYQTAIIKIIREALTENKNSSNETIQKKINYEGYVDTVSFLLEKEDFPFPPFCVLNAVYIANSIPEINEDEVLQNLQQQIKKYLECIGKIVESYSKEELISLIETNNIVIELKIQFNQLYNGMEQANNYFSTNEIVSTNILKNEEIHILNKLSKTFQTLESDGELNYTYYSCLRQQNITFLNFKSLLGLTSINDNVTYCIMTNNSLISCHLEQNNQLMYYCPNEQDKATFIKCLRHKLENEPSRYLQINYTEDNALHISNPFKEFKSGFVKELYNMLCINFNVNIYSINRQTICIC